MTVTVPGDLVLFIQKRRAKGVSDSTLVSLLLQKNWSHETVVQALKHPLGFPKQFQLDERLLAFIAQHLGTPIDELLQTLVQHGWSVAAIRFGISYLLDHQKTLDRLSLGNQESFVGNHRKNFLTKFKERSAHSVEQKQTSSKPSEQKPAEQKEKTKPDHLKNELEKLKQELEDKEKSLLAEENLRRDDALSAKIDDMKRMLAFQSQQNLRNELNQQSPPVAQQQVQPQVQAPVQPVVQPSAPQPVVVQSAQAVQPVQPTVQQPVEQSKQGGSAQPVFVVNEEKGGNLEELEKRFETMMHRRGEYFEYTNPIIPEKLHLVETAKAGRVQTGISGLDPIIEGGLRTLSTTLVGGGPGTGKSTLCLQYLVEGVLKYGEHGVYISFEETKESIVELGKQFGWDLEQMEKDKQLMIKEYSPEQIDKILEAGGGSLRDLIDSLQAKRIVIDSITAFMLMYSGETAQRRACLQLFRSLAKWGCTTFAIAEEQGNMGKHEASVLEYEAGAVILLYNERKGDIRQRSLEIFKMRGTRHAGRIFPMRIRENGIEVYPRETF